MKNSLRYYRKKAGLTLEQLAAASGLGLSTIGHVETGRADPSQEFLEKVAKVLEISPAEILEKPQNSVISSDYRVEESARSRSGYTGFDLRGKPEPLSKEQIALFIRLATQLRNDARELRSTAERMEKEAKTLERWCEE